MPRRILFLYLTKHSGHYAAAVAIERAVKRLAPGVETMMLDSFSHANPKLSKVTLKAYLAMLRTAPEIWEYMYDNPGFKERTKKIREFMNRGNSKKLQKILTEFDPDVIVCTQGFACGVVASWKRAMNRTRPALVGVLTDFVAHRYWADEQVNLYIAPSETTKETLVSQNVPDERVTAHGIPVCEDFNRPVDREAVILAHNLKSNIPTVLLMGGSLGLGPIKSVIRRLDKLPPPFNMVVITGKNEELKERLEEKGVKLRHPTRIYGFVENINELMDVADIAITKPGGMTTAEALIKALPMIIINPIPGQEVKNTGVLLQHKVAVKADKPKDVARYVAEFLRNPDLLSAMRENARGLGRPDAATRAAEAILKFVDHKEAPPGIV